MRPDYCPIGGECPIVARHIAALAALRAQPAEPLVFGMRGPKMTFTIGNQSFTLDYEPETTEEYVFMGNMLKAAISKLPRGVKIGAQPADPFKKLSDAQVLWLAESHGIDVYASNPLAFYADLISTTPAQPDHSELVKDAARYRWLREQHWSDSKFAVVSNPKVAVNLGSICPSRELLDEAIDAAIGETME